MLQKCPICRGVGTVSGNYFTRTGDTITWSSASTTEKCRCCGGTGLIDDHTGKPPEESKDDGPNKT